MLQISEFLPGILLAYSAFLLAIVSPGPNFIAVIGTSMSAGRPSGVALAFGVAFGSLTWALLTVVGLTTLLTLYASALTAIKIFGGLYLLWLAYKSFKSAAARQDLKAQKMAGEKRTLTGFLLRGYLVQITNPKAALAWIAIISLGMQNGAPLWVAATIVLGTFVLSVVVHVLYAIAFSTPLMVRLYGRARRGIQFTLGSFFAFAGMRLLTRSN
ncbi:MAG: LysE family translocator [Roseibium sp.]|uniref:LysE family translocator n=1 Tax=Roseibium sp. TaxID=1936156 RepID=UPI002625456F|nr:LysE family transporter [Roseibium sp.]MCV0424065.1 LysE family translocator [Roseibium sp.]